MENYSKVEDDPLLHHPFRCNEYPLIQLLHNNTFGQTATSPIYQRISHTPSPHAFCRYTPDARILVRDRNSESRNKVICDIEGDGR